MRDQWVDHCLAYSAEQADFYSGCRKILTGRSFAITRVRDDLTMADAGFTKMKMAMLKRLYIHQESIDAATTLWKDRTERQRYGSVGFHCFNHYMKGADGARSLWEEVNAKKRTAEGKTSRASRMGPCIQSVSLTLMPDNTTRVDLFYRTTELFKKFPADLVFIRDVLLAPFDFTSTPLKGMRFHFANVTCHPMYFVTILPLLEDPIAELDTIKAKDRRFFDWTVKWTSRYLCDEHHRGIAKFAQALRVMKDARERITCKELPDYLRDNHPGHRGDYQDVDVPADEE